MERNQDFEELMNYIRELVFPLLGLPQEEIENASKQMEIVKEKENFESIRKFESLEFGRDNKTVYIDLQVSFGEIGIGKFLKIVFSNEINPDMFKLLSFLICSYVEYGQKITKDYIDNALIKERINELILQKGLLSYLLDDNHFKNHRIDNLYKCLQRWSEKTYEGHNVCFGFLINPKSNAIHLESDSFDDFVDFIGEEYSAVFTDGITSVVEIDKNCNFIKYHSILHQKEIMPENYNDVKLPIRFAQIIYQNVIDGKIGVFLLTNGDIIASQKQKITFVRRNGRWLNFSDKSFNDSIADNIKTINFDKNLLPGIYCSCLDISFAHSGGLLAVVDENNELWQKDLNAEKPLVSESDLLNENDFKDIKKTLETFYEKELLRINSDQTTSSSVKKGLIKDLKKKTTKKRFLLEILKDNQYFLEIDRKLRADLSGLDGAIILNTEGKILACGAIIANSAGSSGGGRGSAARTLSKYGGFAIKISTDGYIEAFYKEARIYSIK